MTDSVVEEVCESAHQEEMVRRMRDNEEKIATQEETLREHDKIISLHSEQIKNIENSSLKLENLVMTENRETRSVITATNQELHTLINNLLGYKTGENQLKHSVKMSTVESIVKIVTLLAGSGGIIWYVITQ